MQELAFNLLKRLCLTAATMFGHDSAKAVNMYSDASGTGGGCLITQVQHGEERPL